MAFTSTATRTPAHLPARIKNRPALHKAMGIPEGRMVSMGALMESTKKKLKPKAGGKLPMHAAVATKPATVKDTDEDGY